RNYTKPASGPSRLPMWPERHKKRGVWGESRLAFESIVEEVRRFVARMPPVDSTTGSGCCPRSFSALGDQGAEVLPVQRPRALAVSVRHMMRLRRKLKFPFSFSQHHGSVTLYIEAPSTMPRKLP